MKRPWATSREEVQVKSARETKLILALDNLSHLTDSLKDAVTEVTSGDLGAGERRR